jgi:hypothetical protein
MTSEYRVEKLKHHLAVVLTDGRRLEGEVFLRPVSRHRARPEDPVDMLNDAEPFFVLVSNGENGVLVAKSNVSYAETSYDGEADFEAPVLGVPVEVTMTDGNVCTGNIFLETRVGRPRLLDFLNSYRARFIPVVDVGKILLVNTHTIAHVREVA